MSRFLGKWNWWLCKLQKNWHRIFYKHRILNYHIIITLTCLLLKPYFIQTKLAFFSLDLQVKVGVNVYFLLLSSNDFVRCKSNYLLPQVVQLNCNPRSSSECPITGGHLNRMVTFVLVVLSELNYYWEKICNFELRSSVLNWQQEKISRKNLKIVWNLGKILLPKNSKILKAQISSQMWLLCQ